MNITPMGSLLYGSGIPLLQHRSEMKTAPIWSLGDVIRKARHQRRWTQETLAEKAAVNVVSVVRLERTSDRAERSTIERVARALDFPLSQLYRYVEHSMLFAELTEGQQTHVIEMERRLAEKNRAADRKRDSERPVDQAVVTVESVPRARARQRR